MRCKVCSQHYSLRVDADFFGSQPAVAGMTVFAR
jgi:hypothetical protein